MRKKMKCGALALLGCLGGLGFSPPLAGQQLPGAGRGKAKIETRFYRADSVFPASTFGSQTLPSKTRITGTLTKVVGDYGLGGKWALLYHLRFASLDKAKKRATSTAFGFEDQTIGVERGFRQSETFSDSVALKFVLPTGSTTSVPQLGTGHFAIEPDYQFGFTRHLGRRFVYGEFSAGPRVFANGGATQLRSTGEIGGRLVKKVNVFGTLFLARTLDGRVEPGEPGIPSTSELYDLLRVGGGIEFTGWGALRPMIAYERDVAGQGIHAGSRLVVGFTLHFNRGIY